MKKQYASRSALKLGKYYARHLAAMAAEKLHMKCDIAAELAYRDMLLDQKWLPIEDAPKDGTIIILARFGWWRDSKGHDPGSIEWRDAVWDTSNRVYGLWWARSGFWSEKWKNWNDGIEPSGLNSPTHHMPLPGTPTNED